MHEPIDPRPNRRLRSWLDERTGSRGIFEAIFLRNDPQGQLGFHSRQRHAVRGGEPVRDRDPAHRVLRPERAGRLRDRHTTSTAASRWAGWFGACTIGERPPWWRW